MFDIVRSLIGFTIIPHKYELLDFHETLIFLHKDMRLSFLSEAAGGRQVGEDISYGTSWGILNIH